MARQRWLEDPLLVSPPDEDCLEEGRRLLERLTPEQVAGALMRLYREKLPPPEDVQDDAPPRWSPVGREEARGEARREPPARTVGALRATVGAADRARPKANRAEGLVPMGRDLRRNLAQGLA